MSSKSKTFQSTTVSTADKEKSPRKGWGSKVLSRVSRSWRRKPTVSTRNPTGLDPHPAPSLDLPVVIWLTHVFAFLDRFSQDALVQIHRELWLSRDHSNSRWPPRGRVSKFSRPVKSIAFVTQNNTDHKDNGPKELLWVAHCKPRIKIIDKLKGPVKQEKTIQHARGSILSAVQASPLDSGLIATAGDRDGCIRLWQSNSNSNKDTNNTGDPPKWRCIKILEVYQHNLRHLTWAPNGQFIATWGQEGLLQVSSVTTGNLHGTHWKTKLEVPGCHRTVVFAPNGKSILYARNHNTVHQWDFGQSEVAHRVLAELQDQHGSHPGNFITGMAFSPDGNILVIGCHVATLLIWDVLYNDDCSDSDESMEYVYNRRIHVGGGWSAVALLTFSPDGRFLACTNQGTQIRIIDLEEDRVRVTWKGHTGRIESLCFSSCGTLASGACDRTVRFWDMEPLTRENAGFHPIHEHLTEDRMGMV